MLYSMLQNNQACTCLLVGGREGEVVLNYWRFVLVVWRLCRCRGCCSLFSVNRCVLSCVVCDLLLILIFFYYYIYIIYYITRTHTHRGNLASQSRNKSNIPPISISISSKHENSPGLAESFSIFRTRAVATRFWT